MVLSLSISDCPPPPTDSGGVAYMMGASGSLSMVDKLQSLEDEAVDCERLVPECESPKLREAMSLGTTIQKFTAMVAEWMGW